MALITVRDLSLAFNGPNLLEDVNLQIQPAERICLLGRNGAGKSTFMKLLLGQHHPDHGEIIRHNNASVVMLPQEVPNDLQGSIFDQVALGLGPKGSLLAEYHHTSLKLAEKSTPALLNKLDELQHELDAQNAWDANREVERVLTRMNLPADDDVASLSAGMKRRTLLARAIVSKPDVLLLDEPTNHLDIAAINWLENFLAEYEGCLIFVTHDRMFLRKLSTRILDIDRAKLTSWACNYETYLKRKEEMVQAEAKQNELFDKKLAEEEVWIRRGIQARRTRNEGRVRALKKMREERKQRREQTGNVKMTMQDAQATGRLVIEAKNISFAYDETKPIITNFSTTIMRGDRIGIIGPNGSGKTTLIRVLLAQLHSQTGTIRLGTNLQLAYFDQLHAQLDNDKSVIENVADSGDKIIINGQPRHAIGYLQDFLFEPARARGPIWNLSGGERNRLLLAKLFTKPHNVLILDEPTNDLDAETLELLEELLQDYAGTILIVSHDREFLNNVVTSTFVLDGNGIVKEYDGGYDDYLRQHNQNQPAQEKDKPKKSSQELKNAHKNKDDKPRKLTYNEKKELDKLPAQIEKLETQLAQLHQQMTGADFYKKDSATIAQTTQQATDLDTQLQQLYQRWEELEELA